MNNEDEQLLNSLHLIFQKVKTQNTLEESLELLGVLVKESKQNPKRMNSLFQQLTAHNLSLQKGEKKESLILLPAIYQSIENIKLLYPYIDKILLIFQSSIADDSVSIYPLIAKAFSETTLALISMNITPEQVHISHDVIEVYEKMKLFCINNMKSINKPSQIVGTLCLTNFIEACCLNYKNENLKMIWENIIYLIDKKTFNAKLELLNCLISLIFSSESAFRPFATVTLYKILDYLTDNDWLKRKLALNVVYTLVFYCKSEIIPLHEYITEFLEVLRNDKVAEVREVCLQTLKYFSDHSMKPIQENELKRNNQKKTVTKSSLKRSSGRFSTIKQLNETNISREDVDRRAKTPLMKNGHCSYFAQKTDGSSKKLSISTKKITFPKKNNTRVSSSSSVPKYSTPGDLSQRNANKEDKRSNTIKNERMSNNSNGATESLSDLSFKLQTYMEIHANHINSLNDSIQGLAHRVRQLETELDNKLKKDKRKAEFKVEMKNKNYDKAFQISLELKAKYILQIIRRMKETDYQKVSSSQIETSVEILFNDLDENANVIHLILLFFTNVTKFCQLSLNTHELKQKIINNCNELLALKEEYSLRDEDIQSITLIVNSLNQSETNPSSSKNKSQFP